MSIAQRIRELREAKGLSQEELAEAVTRLGAKFSQQSVANVETGIVTSPRPILELAQALDTTVQYLRTGASTGVDGKKDTPAASSKKYIFSEEQSAAPTRSSLDVLMYDIYDPEKMSPEEEKAVFTLQRYLRRKSAR